MGKMRVRNAIFGKCLLGVTWTRSFLRTTNNRLRIIGALLVEAARALGARSFAWLRAGSR